jgi:glutamate/tyrosine decarboxylase-like PLP-dependent enzyme
MSDDLIARIRALEATARALEPDVAARAAMREPAIDYAERFLEAIGELPAFVGDQERARPIAEGEIGEGPTDVRVLLDRLGRHVDQSGINPASGGHLGYIPGGGVYAAALGDYLADITNRYAGVFYANPGAVLLEHHLLAWMARLLGYPEGAAGTFCSGGSVANLTAIVAAREARGIRAADIPRVTVYLTSQTHHCVPKALRIAGLAEAVVRPVPLDERYRMRPDALDRMVREDREAGRAPWLVVASAGSTDVGAVDPLDAIAEVASAHGLWFHVDAAYGGFFVLVERCWELFRGMERSDSVVVDPHKTLFLPYGSGAVLLRDRAALLRAFSMEAAYLQDAAAGTDLSPSDVSIELTRPFRGPRLWFPLLLHGLAPFRAALEEKLLLARYFRRKAAALGYEVGPEPDLSVVVYRYLPSAMRRGEVPRDPEAISRINRDILDALLRDGRVFLSSTMLDGEYTLRFACVVHRTHLPQVDLLLSLLAQAAAEIEAEGRVASLGAAR